MKNTTKNPNANQDAANDHGGNQDQHSKADQQNHGGSTQKADASDSRGGSHEQHVKAGEQTHKGR